MPKYRLTCDVRRVHGQQTFVVVAANKLQALALYKQGKSEFEAEELEVLELSREPRIDLIE